MKTLLLYGGGIDSTTLLAYMRRELDLEVTVLFINYGQVAAAREAEAVVYFAERYGADIEFADVALDMGTSSILTGVNQGDRASNVLDGRNAILLSLAACYAANKRIPSISIGYHHEPDKVFPDAGIPFFDAYQKVMNAGLVNQVQLLAPFRNLLRSDLFALADLLDPKIIDRAHTCYASELGGCGSCSHCLQKASYVRHIPDDQTIDRIRQSLDNAGLVSSGA